MLGWFWMVSFWLGVGVAMLRVMARPTGIGMRFETVLAMGSQLILLVVLFLVAGCAEKEVHNNKDLGQNMMDLRIYQENLGEYIRANNLEDASWLLEDMDSILLILNKRFAEHRKLAAPFSYYYKKELRPPINGIRRAIRKEDTARALQQYRILINNCNDCHIDNEVDKEVVY